MGNQTSSINKDELKPKSISQVLDYISTYYIVTMNFTSLKKLYDKEYCDKLVILTADIVQRYFTDMEITYLAERVKDGDKLSDKPNSDLAKGTDKPVSNLEKDRMIFFDKNLKINNHMNKIWALLAQNLATINFCLALLKQPHALNTPIKQKMVRLTHIAISIRCN